MRVKLSHTSFIDGLIKSTRVLIEQKGQGIDLRKAHQQNDKAVMEAYGMSVRETTEATCVAELMRRYQELTQ